ncbi:MAG: DUF1361 domain-containing protein [Synechococcales cyanobacterium CRU_2_2]|nr:DUF1361 domain-containing protein [Synechococcales cyanobacterium CRU_2_2]
MPEIFLFQSPLFQLPSSPLLAISAASLRAFVERAGCKLFPPLCLFPDSGWIAWNLFLAAIPLVLSVWLFRRPRTRRTLAWWAAFLVYVAFLPNAPYLLTDIIHSVQAARLPYPAWVIILLVIPLHFVAIVGGFQAYVISLINQQAYLVREGAKRFVNWAELMMHGLCAIGIFLGRFHRLNSWDLVQAPSATLVQVLDTLTTKWPAFVILITFLIITILYWIMKQVTLGLVLRYRELRAEAKG